MGYEVYEWNFTVMDVAKTTGGAPPAVDDDSGSLFAVTAGTADSPTVYTDKDGTTLTETNGVAKLTFSNGHVRFYTDQDVSSLDIYWISKRGCGILRGVGPNKTHGLKVGYGGKQVWGIPLRGPGATAAGAEVNLGITPASGVMLTKVWADIISAAASGGHYFDFGVLASSSNGNADGFIDSGGTSAVGLMPLSVAGGAPIGVLSQFKFDGSNDILSFTPAASNTMGVIAYMELVF
jgi:hypothetical protein